MIATGALGLNEEIGRYPRGSLIVVKGGPGTGKTSLCLAFLKSGVEVGEKVVYVTFVESKRDLAFYAKRFNIDLLGLEAKGLIKVEEVPTMVFGAESLLRAVLGAVEELRASRLILDSFTAIRELFANEQEVRSFLHNVFLKTLKREEVTTMISLEVLGPYEQPLIEEYVADVIIELRQSFTDEGVFLRELVVRKFRGTYLRNKRHCFTLHGGFQLFTRAKEVVDEPLTHEVVEEVEGRFSTGIKGLDEVLGGGLEQGKALLMVYDDWLPVNPLCVVTPAIFQSVFKGRRVLVLPSIGVRRLKQILTTSLTEKQIVDSLRALLPLREGVKESWVAPLKLKLEEDFASIMDSYLKLRRLGPTLVVLDMSSIMRLYGQEAATKVDEVLRVVRDQGDVAVNIAPRSCPLLNQYITMHDYVLRLFEVNKAIFIRGIKPPTEAYHLDIRREGEVRRMTLTPMV